MSQSTVPVENWLHFLGEVGILVVHMLWQHATKDGKQATAFCTSSSISASPIPSPTFYSPLCSSITPSLVHLRLKTCFTNPPPPVVSLLPRGLPSWTYVSSELLGFCFSSFFFVSVPCARLNWTSRQLFSTQIYRIISYTDKNKDNKITTQ